MIEKIDLYDLLTAIFHGVLFLSYVIAFFAQGVLVSSLPEMPETVIVMVFVALSYFCGQVLSALSSLLQNALYWSWGGMPSDIVLGLKQGRGFISSDSIDRAISVLKDNCGQNASIEGMFAAAMVIARNAEGSLSERHNRMYAYYRISLTNLILCFCFFSLSCCMGWGCGLVWSERTICAITLALLIILHWFRVKQRAFYYVREVLLVATRELTR